MDPVERGVVLGAQEVSSMANRSLETRTVDYLGLNFSFLVMKPAPACYHAAMPMCTSHLEKGQVQVEYIRLGSILTINSNTSGLVLTGLPELSQCFLMSHAWTMRIDSRPTGRASCGGSQGLASGTNTFYNSAHEI